MIHFGNASPDVVARVREVQANIFGNGAVSVWTSGTTGKPKQLLQSSAVLNKRTGGKNERWVLCYSPFRWAGVSVINYCVRSDCELFIPRDFVVSEIYACAVANGITHVSLTPSLFRNLLLLDTDGGFRALGLQQITFGGEYCVQAVLDFAKRVFPGARLTHTYASTECGDICAVSDGLAGYPEEKFSAFAFRENGELVVKGVSTGDIWTLSNGRYTFQGREHEVINVGGHKVSPHVIEDACLQLGAIAARAYGVPSVIVGQMVALDYVGELSSGVINEHFRATFPKYAWPIKINRVNDIQLTDAGKTRRA